MGVVYESNLFSFGDIAEGDMYIEVEFQGEVFGYASFKDHWTWEHSSFTPVPRDLSGYGIDTSGEDGPSLFKNGVISWDNDTRMFVYVDDEEPAMGGRYIGVEEGSGIHIEDCFSIGSDIVVFHCVGD